MKKLFPNSKKFVLVSLGTGKVVKAPASKSGWFSFGSNKNDTEHITTNINTLLNIFELSMSSESIHRRVCDAVNESTDRTISYYRFNPTLDSDIPLDTVASEVFDLMIKKTKDYLASDSDFDKVVQEFSRNN